MLKKLAIGLALLALGALATIFIAGLLLPAERSFTNEIEIDAPAEVVWQVLTDKQRYTEWQTPLDRVEIVDDRNWIEYPKNSPEPLRFRLVNDGRPRSMELAYTMGDSMQGGWIGEVTPTAKGVRLKTTDSHKINGFLMKVLLGVFFDLDTFAKDWNRMLKQRAEEQKQVSKVN